MNAARFKNAINTIMAVEKSTKFTMVCGADDFLVSRLGQQLWAEKANQVLDDFGKEIVNGAVDTVADVEKSIGQFAAAVGTLPLFGDKKVIWFKDIMFLADSRTGKAQGTLAQVDYLKRILENLDPEAVDVLITASPVDRRRAFPKWCEKQAQFHLAGDDKNNINVLAKLVADECHILGVTMGQEAVEALIAKVNGNSRLVLEETRKLATWLGQEGEIGVDDITELVPSFGEGDFFESVEAFYSLNLAWTLAAIRRHFFAYRDSRGMLANLRRRNRLLIQLRALMDEKIVSIGYRGITGLDKAKQKYGHYFVSPEEKTPFNVMNQNPWYLKRLSSNIAKLPLKRLINFQKEFLNAFEETISRPDEQEEVMRNLAIRCLSTI